MITFYEDKNIFKLDSKNSTYVIGIYEENYLLNLYYGSKLNDVENLFDSAKRIRTASFSPSNPNVSDDEFSVDCAPMEYSCNGSGDFRISALTIKNNNGDRVTDMRYKSHKIYNGKNTIEKLPHIYVNDDDKVETLEIITEDIVTGVITKLFYTVFDNQDPIIRSAKIENPTKNKVNIERAFSLSLDLPSMDYELLTLYGRHYKERTEERRKLAHGIQGVQSKRGVSSHNQNPFAALVGENTTENIGSVYGFNLIYSGNFEFSVECDYGSTTRVLMGINPTDFDWVLNSGESFQTPECVMVYTEKGLGEMSRAFHNLYLDNLLPKQWKNIKKPILINSWEAAYFDFNTEKLVSFAERAKELGIEMLVMDDGWFGKRNSDNCSLGDWYVNEEKLPGGLGELIKKVKALGLKFGIWYEPEMISPDSDLFRAHPDWYVHVDNRTSSIARQQYVLDVSRKDVRDNIFNQMYNVFSNYDIDYIKWDFNRNISEAGSAILPKEQKGEFFHRFILGTYDLMERFTKAFPNVLFENCSGGGGRFDPGMLYYSSQIWASDNTDPIERLTIQFGTSMCYPATCMGAHVSACSRTSYETKGNVALWGTFGYELDPNDLTDENKKTIKNQVKEYHKYYDLIHKGELFRLIDPYKDMFRCAWSFVSKDKKEALVTVVVMRKVQEALFILKLNGLDSNKKYFCEYTNKIYSGEFLMKVGLNLTEKVNDTGDSIKIYLKEV